MTPDRIIRWIVALAAMLIVSAAESAGRPPNFVVIFADDLGYGDLGCFGHPTIRTPNLDRMAAEGQKWTSFYVAANVCTPSRAALMTGRYPIRSGMCSSKRRVLFPDSAGGLPRSEITIARQLKKRGYATEAIGKWHLGHLPRYLPTRHGFDSYFGIPYSNDMDRTADSPRGRRAFLHPDIEYFNVPLMEDEKVVERPADQRTLTRRYTEHATGFMRANKDQPFFLYLAYSLPHVPLFRSEAFADKSRRGLYGDVVEEIDWSVGELLDTLRELKIDENTMVVFTSDNGPWLVYDEQGGSAGILSGGKGSTWEGGQREPTIFWWPGRIAPEVVADMGSTLDLFPTLSALADVEVPTDRVYDGYDLSARLFGRGESPRREMIYYWGEEIYAARLGDYKAHFTTKTEYVGRKPVRHERPLLHNLEHDPSEKYDIGEKHPEIIADIRKLVEKHKASIKPVENQLVKRIGE